ncbi:MAG: histidine phosphatase family protein [Candidatus Polarisedimenticolaceae bacterium]|nr:histidine phosphatase family protein [Candidatus Polarisedimenticolaceae bacterium]
MVDLIIDLLRHGEVEGGHCFRGRTDDLLTDLGWSQMSHAVEMKPTWREIISSPAKRCTRFAKQLAENQQIPCRQAEWLWEMDFGDWEGATAAQLAATDADRLNAFWQDPVHQAPPNGEPFQPFQQRVLGGWSALIQQSTKHILLVTHGGPIRIILAEVLGMPPQNLMRLEVPHASLSRVRISTDPAGKIYGSLVGLNRVS